MKIESLIGEIEQIDRIVKTWKENEVPAIERGIVMDKLRRLYEQVAFAVPEEMDVPVQTVAPSSADAPAAPASATCVEPKTDEPSAQPAFAPVVTPVPAVAVDTQPIELTQPAQGIADNSFDMSVIAAKPASAEDSAVKPAESEVAPTTTEQIAPEVGENPMSEPVAEERSETETASETQQEMQAEESPRPELQQRPAARRVESEVEEPKLFNEDEAVYRPRVDKQVILSLYGDDRPSTVNVPTPQTMRPVVEDDNSPVRTVIDTSSDSSHKKVVLGETLGGATGMAMNEKLGKQNAHTDVAAKLQFRSINGDLRQQIGINDRFMLIRSLFGGDASAYDAAIDRFNSFTELDDAMLYMQENFTWNPDSEGVALLVELLERKLG